MKNTIAKHILGLGIATGVLVTALIARAPSAPTAATSTTQTTQRVTFHNAKPGPLTLALIDKYAGTEVVVQQQHFVHKRRIAEIIDDEWVFNEDKLRATLLHLKPIYEDAWDPDLPAHHLLMLDSEPIATLYGAGRIEVLQDALGLAHQILGQTVQVGFYANPSHKGLANGRPPDRFTDGVLAQQGAIFIVCSFSNKGNRWFEKGMRQTQTLLDRIAPIRGDRPVVGYVWRRRWPVAGMAIIPDDQLREHLRLLVENDVQISVADFSSDSDAVHLIELAREVMLEEQANG